MKTPEEIKRGLECCRVTVGCKNCPYNTGEFGCQLRNRDDALAYIQQLETENHQLLTKAQQLESTISQVSKALCGKEKATLKELLQAADQLKARAPRWISVEERLPPFGEVLVCGVGKWVGVCWHHGEGFFEAGSMFQLGNDWVTHWMPLPEPTEEDEHAD